MINNIREAIESPVEQGVNEKVVYRIKIPRSWGTSPATPVFEIKNNSTQQDVSEACAEGDPELAGQLFKTPLIKSLENGVRYTLRAQWQDSGNTFDAYLVVVGAA